MNFFRLKRWLVVAVSSLLLVTTIAFRPTAALAEGLPVIDISNQVDRIKTAIQKNWKTVVNTVIRTALNTFLSKLAYDSAVFVASGFSGQQSALQTQPIGEYLLSTGDAALGGAIEGFATSTGLDAAGLCDPGADFRINLTLGLETNFGQAQQPYKPACTLSELGGNWKKAYSDPDFSKFFEFQFDSTANPLGIALEVNNLTLQKKVDAIEEAKIQRLKGDFKDKAALVSKTIVTPGSLIEDAYQKNTDPKGFLYQMTEEPLVNAVNIFSTTLITKLMDRIKNGVVPVNTGQNLATLLAVGSSSGRKAAEALYADLKQPAFTTSGAFDVLSELSNCPAYSGTATDGSGTTLQPTVNNCAIGTRMRDAVIQGMSVQEFVDVLDQSGKNSYSFANDTLNTTGNIMDDDCITYKGILLLKKYRIVPVGWQLAAEYIRHQVNLNTNDAGEISPDQAPIPTLKQVMNCYNACGGSAEEALGCELTTQEVNGNSSTNYSPYCKLVDPNWILKTPQNYCVRQGTGPDLAVSAPLDDDANVSTQQTMSVSRLDYCADNRGCISENDNGECAAYGYCTKENRIYRFQGTSCDQPNASCQTFTDTDDNEVSYLKSSLNYDDCATDPGCQWYCNSKDSTGNFNCASSTTTLITCEDKDGVDGQGDGKADNTSNFDYVTNNGTCACSVQQTCQVAAGSDRGTDANTDGVYDYWQCLVPDSGAVCTLDDTCGADNPAYISDSTDSNFKTCTCTLQASCSVTEGQSQCTVSLPSQNGSTTAVQCGDTSNSCSSDDSTYSATPVCKATGEMNCVDSTGKAVTDSCDIIAGATSCTSSSGNICIIGTVDEVPAEHNDTLFLDDNAEECASDDAGCNRYGRVLDNTNLLPNAFFTYNTTGENVRHFVGFCSNTGVGCATDAECNGEVGACKGWLQNDATVAVSDDSADDINTMYVELSTDSATGGTLTNTIDTGYSLSNRTFTFAYRARASGADCTASVGFSVGMSGATPAYQASSAYTTDWTNYSGTFTFADDDALSSNLTTSINATNGCTIQINATQLTESGSAFDNTFTDYGNNQVYLNGNTLSCQAEDVGCELYTQVGKSRNDGIPGIITNADASACVNADGSYDYANPECNQCNGDTSIGQTDDYYVGCDFYQAAPLTSTTPIQLSAENIGQLDEQSISGATERTGYYCSGDNAIHCYADSDCTGNGVCQPLISIVPSTATQCSVAQVGCEAYTNLAAVEQGGEGVEYYTQLQQCVKTTDNDIGTFYTFEGSNSGGVQVQDHLLKKSNLGNGPCTHLDLLSQEFNAECKDSTDPASQYYVHDCGPNGEDVYDSSHPDCRQYVNDAGDVFYRYESETIPVTDDCTALRNSTDGRTYYALPSNSVSCSEEAVGCREYKGTDSGDVTNIIDEDFSSNSIEGWVGAVTTANESVLQGDYSLQFSGTSDITHSLATQDADGAIVSQLTSGKSYILTFWAKDNATASPATFKITGLSADYYFTTQGSTINAADAAVTLNPYGAGGWQYYKVGPIVLSDTEVVDGTENFVMQYQGSGEAYIDTIQLIESSSQYLVQDTARLCQNFEGCRQYNDRADTAQYLKSFQRLCDEAAVGCEALINTHNSANPFAEGFNLDNEYTQDDTIVPADSPITVVYNEQNTCSEQVYGCTEFGKPDEDQRTGKIDSYTPTYLYNRPDDYNSILCQQPQLACRQYTSDYDGTAYFKDPGDKVCELKTYQNSENLALEGWFKKDSVASNPDCPLQYEDLSDTYASQPLGGVCNSNSVVHNSDGTVANRIGSLCTTDADCYPTDWQSGLPTPRCISDPEDDVDEYSASHNNDDGLSLAQVRGDDFGWVGTCASEQSGCTEYIDPYSPNIEELNNNWSFEYDVYSNNGSLYQDGDVPTGWPDDWLAPTDIDLDGDGVCDSNCGTSPSVVMTIPPAYPTTEPTVKAADGAAAVQVTDGMLVNAATFSKLQQDQSYTLQAMVRIPISGFATADNLDPAKLSIGLLYYAENPNQSDPSQPNHWIQLPMSAEQTYITAHEVTIAEDTDVDQANGLSKWYRLQGNIGLGTSVPIPTAVCSDETYTTYTSCVDAGKIWYPIEYSQVFITNHTSTPIYFDVVSFKQNDRYYYIDYTVDGTAEHKQNSTTDSCSSGVSSQSEITADGGCVAFHDTTTDTQTQSQDGLACSVCMLNPNSETCRGILDACDTNTILHVKRDRACSEWLACRTAYVVDTSGEQAQECFSIQGCTQLDQNNNCAEWADTRQPEDLSGTSDVHFSSAIGDTDSLSAARDLTGYVKAGLVWQEERLCNALSGEGFQGQYCREDKDCYSEATAAEDIQSACGAPFSVEGYYPYGWMYEAANYGPSHQDFIKDGMFEKLYCRGTDANLTRSCLHNATNSNPLTSQCYESSFTDFIKDENKADPKVFYDDDSSTPNNPSNASEATAYCPNTPDFINDWPFTGWSSLGGGKVFISQYDANHNCTDATGCPDVDVNNVLQFEPKLDTNTTTGTGGTPVRVGQAFSAGVQYNLESTIVGDADYALSFDGRYPGDYTKAENSSDPSALSVCLHYDNILNNNDEPVTDLMDCFVNGYGAADIVFLLDDSNSMHDSGIITPIGDGITSLAKTLKDQGIDAQFALATLDSNSSSSTPGTAFTDLRQDFTDSTTFTNESSALYHLAHDPKDNAEHTSTYYHNSDPYAGVIDIAKNELNTQTVVNGVETQGDIARLSFRDTAQRFVILVTNRGDQLVDNPDKYNLDNGINEKDAKEAAKAANMPVFVVTSNWKDGYNSANINDKCVYAGGYPDPSWHPYDELTSYTGGNKYTFSVDSANQAVTTCPDGSSTVSTDWSTSGITNAIFSLIINTVDVFQLTNEMKNYTFGPLHTSKLGKVGTEYKVAPGAPLTTRLEFLGADAAAVQLDNVSMLPVLEVNQDVSPISRSCRAYPTSDSKQCDYIDAKNTAYRGWHGYCLEQDPTNTNRCITWYPLDVIAGESTLLVGQDAVQVRVDTYSCLVTKGAEAPGFCVSSNTDLNGGFGNGISCATDQTCVDAGLGADATCYRGEIFSSHPHPIVACDPEIGCPYDPFVTGDTGDYYTKSAQDVAADTNHATQNCSEYADDPDVFSVHVCDDGGDVICYQAGSGDTATYSCPIEGNGCMEELAQQVNLVKNKEVTGKITSADAVYPNCNGGQDYTCESVSVDCIGNANYEAQLSQEFSGGYHARVASWGPPALEDTGAEGEDRHSGFVSKFTASPLMKNIHVSEIETVEYHTGSAGDTEDLDDGVSGDDNTSSDDDEYFYWGQNDGAPRPNNAAFLSSDVYRLYDHPKDMLYNNSSTSSMNNAGDFSGNFGNIWLSDLEHGSITYNDTSGNASSSSKVDPTKNFCYAYNTNASGDSSDARGIGCGVWGLYDNKNYDKSYYQTNANDPVAGKNGYDLVYSWAWSNFNSDLSECHKSGDGDPEYYMESMVGTPSAWLSSPCIEPAVKCVMGTKGCSSGKNSGSQNPWDHIKNNLSDMKSNSWARIAPDGWEAWEPNQTTGYNDFDIEGSNIMSLWVDFNDQGYIQNIYHLYYYDAEDTDDFSAGVQLSYAGSMYVNLYLRESCALISNTVPSDGKHVGWSDRLAGAFYSVIGTQDVLDTTNNPFGSISPQPGGGTPAAWDSFLTVDEDNVDNQYQYNTFGTQPQISYNISEDSTTNSDAVTAGYPVSCVGNCAKRYCIGNSAKIGYQCSSDADCVTPDTTNQGSNITGKCMGIGNSDISGEAYTTKSDSYSAQLTAAAAVGRDYLKHVFANVGSNFYKFNPAAGDGDTSFSQTGDIYFEDATRYWNKPASDADANIFVNMQHCQDNIRPNTDKDVGADTEYCGTYPLVKEFSVNGIEPEPIDGQYYYHIQSNNRDVELTFTIDADDNQEPLNTVYVDFGDGETPETFIWGKKSDTFTFSHSYQCDSLHLQGDHCIYTPKITSVDNWGWCSGATKGDATDRTSSTQNRYLSTTGSDTYVDLITECNSYDALTPSIWIDYQ